MPSGSIVVTSTKGPVAASSTNFAELSLAVAPGGDSVCVGDDGSGSPRYTLNPGGAPMRFDPILWGGFIDLATIDCVTLNASAAAWATSTSYTAGTVVKNGGLLYRCLVGGTSASSGGGPVGLNGAQGTPLASQTITDGTCTWMYQSTATAVLTWFYE